MSRRSEGVKSHYSEINENDEWHAIQKFNTLLYYEEQKQSIMREQERKRLIREELDRQVQAKAMRKTNMDMENKQYDQIYDDHGKLLDQREKQKAEAIKTKVQVDKESRDLQLRDEQHRKRKEQK